MYETYNNNRRSNDILIYENNTTSMLKMPIDRYQSFDNIFTSEKKSILKDIELLKDIEHHHRYGIKRKLATSLQVLRVVEKTCMVTAMAKHLNRTIVYVPISRITKNNQLEKIMYNNVYNGVKYDIKDLIFLFDEIDSMDEDSLLIKHKKDSINKNSKNKEGNNNMPNILINTADSGKMDMTQMKDDTDKLNIGILLNILDGNADQDGLIIVATANDVTKLDSALYRDGRLKHIEFRYMGRDDIANMIEYYYEVELSEKERMTIKDTRKIQSLRIKNVCIEHIKTDISMLDLIYKINALKTNALCL